MRRKSGLIRPNYDGMMQSKSPSDNTFQRDARSIPPRRISHYGTAKKRPHVEKGSDSDAGSAKKRDGKDDDSDLDCYNFEKLKSFHIPRKKGPDEKGLLTELSLTSREFTHTIYPLIRSSFFDSQSIRKLTFSHVELVHNPVLEKEYSNKKKDMKDEGRSEKDLTDCFGYFHTFKRKEAEKICREGLLVGNMNLYTLSKPEMGVYVCKHADVVRFSRWQDGETGYIIMFKLVKGKVKMVTECRVNSTAQEPTPLYDCHITKLPIDVAQASHSRAYQAFQYYLYEYGDIDVVQRPRQLLPYALIKYKFEEQTSFPVAGSRTSRRESSEDSVEVGGLMSSSSFQIGDGFCHWRGKLLVKNGTFCSVELRSKIDTVFNVAILDKTINVKSCLSVEKLKRQLPPTLLSKSAKKHNVFYRGRCYNTFTLHPSEESSGLGKFRQLVSQLVQQSAAAFVPLRNNSSLFLLPLSKLTEEIGLQGSEAPSSEGSKQSQRAWKNFLHVIILSPKALSSRINDQRVFNIVHARKRKESLTNAPSLIRDSLEQRLRQMNIDPSSVLSSMEPDQHHKIYMALREKKKFQSSEKMLHNFYKDKEKILHKKETKAKLCARWKDNTSLQQDLYSGKRKLKAMPSLGTSKRSRSLSRNSSSGVTPVSLEDDAVEEATFSDEEDTSAQSKPPNATSKTDEKRPKTDSERIAITNIPYDSGEISTLLVHQKEKPKHVPFQYTPAPVAPQPATSASPLLRPSFKPLEELIFSENLEELMKHPEFSFSEKYSGEHRVDSYPPLESTVYIPWEDTKPKICVAFTHIMPYNTENVDCPFACDNDPIVLSMLRAMYGAYDAASDTEEDRAKVQWVRKVLHAKLEPIDTTLEGSESGSAGVRRTSCERKIVESVTREKSSPATASISPFSAQGNSTDSGFVSSSSTVTPASENPSLKDIAAILASALGQATAPAVGAILADENKPYMENAAQALLKALADSAESANATGEAEKTEDSPGIDMDISMSPENTTDQISNQTKPQDIPARKTSLDKASPRESSCVSTGLSPHIPARASSSQLQDPRIHGAGRSRPRQSHLLSRHTGPKPRREDPNLTELRKIIPNLSNDSIRRLLANVVNPISKIREAKGRTTAAGTIVKTSAENLVPPGTESESRVAAEMAKAKTLKVMVIQEIGATTTNWTVAKPSLPILLNNPEIGGLSKGKTTKDTTKPTEGSIDKEATTVISATGQHHRAADQGILKKNISPPTKGSTGEKGDTNKVGIGGSTKALNTTTDLKQRPERLPIQPGMQAEPIGTIITQRCGRDHRLSKSRGADPSILTRINPTGVQPIRSSIKNKGGDGATIPGTRPPEDQEDALAIQKTTGDDVRSGPNTRGNSSNNISENNSTLLLSIMNFFNPRQDPRLQKSVARKAHIEGKPEILGKTKQDLSRQMHAILRNLSENAQEKDDDKNSNGKSSGSLSLADIQRIREKKQKMKEKRDAERELSKKEAMHMREELNKSIDRRARHLHQTLKKGKPIKKLGDTSSTCSPADSTTSSNSSELSKRGVKTTATSTNKPTFMLTQPASAQVLSDVAFELAEPKEADNAVARPTGIVTPTPRPVHPIFMQSNAEFPLVGESSAGQLDTNVFTEDISHPAHVITEIDDTLSQLKRGLQSNRNENEVKESTAKLLQLVLKLGGASSEAASHSPSSDLTNSAASLSRFLTSEQTESPNEQPVTRIQDYAQAMPVSRENVSGTDINNNNNLVKMTDCSQKHANRFHCLLSNASAEKLKGSVTTSGNKSRRSRTFCDIRTQFAECRDASVQQFRNKIGANPARNEATSQQNIDEILDKLRPYIETLKNKKPMQENTESGRAAGQPSSDVKKVFTMDKATQPEPETSANSVSETATKIKRHSTAGAVLIPETPQAIPVVVRKPAVELQELSDSPNVQELLRPIAIRPVPIVIENLEPLVIVDRPVQAIETGQTLGVEMTSVNMASVVSPHHRSDSGTPTLDERFPEPLTMKRKVEDKDTNWFVVFDPHKSPECKVIELYLISVKGVAFDLDKMNFAPLEGNMNAKDKDSKKELTMDSIRSQLPDGKLWIVVRTADLGNLHALPHLSLLKIAGPQVQFVCANSVTDIRVRRYKNIFAGEGGIIIPFCPSLLLNKSTLFCHLIMWLIGQKEEDGSKKRKKWKIGLHQHVLNALQKAGESDDSSDQQTADQVLEWLCHAESKKSRVTQELPEHFCDRFPEIARKPGGSEWNWHDTVAGAQLAQNALTCAVKLQAELVKLSRHTVILIDEEPSSPCWRSLWQSGICVSTMERFVDVVCSKPSDSDGSLLLPLYDVGSAYL